MATQLLMAKSPEEAIGCRTQSAVFLAGGTEINRLGSDIADKAGLLISLKKCARLSSIENADSSVKIGAMCTFQQIIESEEAPAYLKEAAHFMASRTKRNMATIGGNIAAARSDSYLLPVLMAVGARLEALASDGEKDISVDSYVYEAPSDMLITAVIVPKNVKVASKRYSNTAQSHAVLTMSAAVTEKGISLAAAVKNSGIYRLTDFAELLGKRPDMSEEEAIKWFGDNHEIPLDDDMFGSVQYKRYLIGYTAYDLCRQAAARKEAVR